MHHRSWCHLSQWQTHVCVLFRSFLIEIWVTVVATFTFPLLTCPTTEYWCYVSLQVSLEEVWVQDATDRAWGDWAIIWLSPKKNTSGFRWLVQVSSQTAKGSEGNNHLVSWVSAFLWWKMGITFNLSITIIVIYFILFYFFVHSSVHMTNLSLLNNTKHLLKPH